MSDDLYDINKYTDKELYDILDLNSPTDRELEAKIIHLINKYSNMQNESGYKMAIFFQQIYNHFFINEEDETDEDEENVIEGMTDSAIYSTSAKNNETNDTPTPTVNPLKVSDNSKVNPSTEKIALTQSFDYSTDKLQLNPLLKQTIKRVISIDSQYRDIITSPLTTSFTFDLSEPLKDVVSLKLYSIQIPYTWYTVSKSYGSNFFYLKGATTGINDGKHDYKITIKPGNYTPSNLVNAINESFQDVSNTTASDVNFNGLPILSYDSTTSKTTVNLNLQKTYTEAYYSLNFPSWTSPISVSGDIYTSIPQYFGFNYQTYLPYSIISNQTYRTTSTIISETAQDFILDNSNNYFTVIQYLGNNEFGTYDSFSTILNTFTIQLRSLSNNNINYTGNVSRSDLLTLINNAIHNSNLFDNTVSQIFRQDIHVGKQNAGNSYFQMNLVLNRNYVKYIPNSKIVVIFPNETIKINQYNESFTIWTIKSSIQTSCLFFDNIQNEFSQIVSETEGVQSSIVVDQYVNMFLKCTTPNYNGGLNDISLNVQQSTSVGYTLFDFVNAITNSFSTKNSQLKQPVFNMTNTLASIDNNNYFNLTIDLVKRFTNKNYSISFDNTSVLCQTAKFKPVYNQDLSSVSIFITDISLSYTGYVSDVSYICTIKPYIGYGNDGNGAAEQVVVTLPLSYDYPITYPTYNAFLLDIKNSIQQVIISNPDINDAQTPLSKSDLTYTVNNNSNNINVQMNINYTYFLSESNYDISFTDFNKTDTSDNAWNILNINKNYNLFEQEIIPNKEPVEYYPYSKIVANDVVNEDKQKTINIFDGSNNIVLSTVNSNAVNDSIILSINPGTYTSGTLLLAMNNAFSANPKTYGSQINSYINPTTNKIYTLVWLNINNIYTTADYNLVFYDPISFITCYAGSRNIQNTTWDTTIGWILGFRDYTQYSLVQANQVRDSNFVITNTYYYLKSITGSYNFTQMFSPKNNVLNTIISLVGDTTLSTNLFNYFLISLDDYIQNHLNDGLVTITRNQTSIQSTAYTYTSKQVCDPSTKTMVNVTQNQTESNNVTNNQLYSLNQSYISQTNQLKTYSAGPFIKDLFGIVPIKAPSKNGDYYIEFGGSLQNQERLYFGPVNIRKMSIQLLNDRGDIVDLNGSNWSFSFICEQLYRSNM